MITGGKLGLKEKTVFVWFFKEGLPLFFSITTAHTHVRNKAVKIYATHDMLFA